MSYRTLRDTLAGTHATEKFEPFRFLADLAAFTSLADEDDQSQQAREILVRVLEDAARFKGYESVIQTLLRSVGLYPYPALPTPP